MRRRLAMLLTGVRLRRKQAWPSAQVSSRAIIDGDASGISLGDGCVIEDGCVLSTQFGGCIRLGNNCTVRRGAMILSYGGSIDLSDNCGVNHYTVLYGHGGLQVGSYTWIAAHSVVIPANHGIADASTPIYMQPLSKKGIKIGADVWIGAGVRILDGVTVGNGAVVGAGSVVTTDLPPYSISAGAPARVIRFREGHR